MFRSIILAMSVIRYSSWYKLTIFSLYDCKYPQSACNTPLAICNIPLSDWTIPVDELKAAELKLCYLSQQDTFSEEIQHLQKGKEIPKNSKLKWISPFIDTQGILRIVGRLSNAHLSESEKHPVILSCALHDGQI